MNERQKYTCWMKPLLLAATLACAAQTGLAQSITVNSLSNLSGSFPSAYGVAVDTEGNIYAVNAGSGTTTGTLVEFPANGAAPVTIGTGLQNPRGVAVDYAGNVYVSQVANNTIEKFAAGSTTGTTYVASGISTPVGMGFDSSNNLYIADYGNNRIVEVSTGGTTTIITNSLFNGSKGLAVDAAGDLYVANSGTNTVIKIAAGAHTATTTLAFTGLSKPLGLALDAAGDLFVADQGNNRIVELPAGSSTQVTVGTGTGLNTPYGIAVDPRGTVLVADNGTGRILGLRTGSADMGSSAYKVATNSATLTFTFSASTTIAGTAFLTQGVAGSDFKDGKTGDTCVAGTYAASATCVLTVTFTPSQVGVRVGAVELLNASNQPLSTVLLRGVGQGASVAVDPGTQTSVGSGFVQAQGIAMDGSGNLYVSDVSANKVFEIPAAGGTPTAVVSGLNKPYGLAIDGAGDLLIADSGDNNVYLVPLEAGALNAGDISTLSSAVASPSGIAVSSFGDAYVTSTSSTQVAWLHRSGGAATLLGSGLSAPQAVALDPYGNIYVADTQNNQVKEFSPAGVLTGTVSNLASPAGMTVDASGTVFVTDTGNNRIVRLSTPAGTLSSTSLTVVATGITKPIPLTADLQGNLYTVGMAAASATKVSRQAASLNFGTVAALQTSAAQSIVVSSTGNATLPLPTPLYTQAGSTADFTVTSATTQGCGSITALAAAAQCSYSAVFGPVASGMYSDTLTFTPTTTLTSAPTALLVGSTMAATTISLAVTSPATGTPTYGQTVQVTATVSSTVAGTITGSVTFTVDSVVQTPITLSSGTAVITLTGLSGGSHSVTASYSGDTTYNASSTASALIVVVSPLGTATGLTASPTSTTSGSPVLLTATVTVPSSPTTIASGSVIFYSGATPLQTVALNAQGVAAYTSTTLPGGTDNITAVYQGTSSFTTSTSMIVVVTVKVRATSTTSLTASAVAINLGQSITFTATVGGTSSSGPPTGSVTFNDGTTSLGSIVLGTSLTAVLPITSLTAGSHTITAVYSGDGNFNPSTSAAVYINVGSFTVSASPSTLTIVNNLTGAGTLSISSVGGYTGNIHLSCTAGLPAYAQCVFSPSTITVAGTSAANVAFVIQTTGGPASGGFAANGHGWLGLICMLLSFGTLAQLYRARSQGRRVLRTGLFFCAVLLALFGMTGCAGNQAVSTKSSPNGTYNVTITAQDTTNNLQQATTLTVIVTQ